MGNTNETQEAYRVGAALRVARDSGLLTDAIIVATGVKQSERLQVLGTVGVAGAGNITTNVKTGSSGPSALYNGGAGKNILVAVANNDSASAVGTKIRTAFGLDADVAAFFAITGSLANVDITVLAGAENDPDMNASITVVGATGLTLVPTSSNLVVGKGINDLLTTLATQALLPAISEQIRVETIKAIKLGRALGLFTAATIEALTTVNALIALTGVPSQYGHRAMLE